MVGTKVLSDLLDVPVRHLKLFQVTLRLFCMIELAVWTHFTKPVQVVLTLLRWRIPSFQIVRTSLVDVADCINLDWSKVEHLSQSKLGLARVHKFLREVHFDFG